MRLTLRTLLAWLDDTLSPGEVREMGRQVSESQYAQELVERIQRVTRQRRLTVPKASGPDGADPNVVAAYLDNELPSDQVAEYERRCLDSDVHLAEVASVHQVLSLIGQKAKVPGPAKWRMYRLIQGPEVGPRPALGDMPKPVEPIAPGWDRNDLVRPSFWEKHGPALAIAGLIAVLAFSAWKVIGPTRVDREHRVVEELASKDQAKPPGGNGPVVQPPAIVPTGILPQEGPPIGEMPGPGPGPETETAKAEPRPEPPEGAFAVVEPGTGVPLRRKPGDGDWERLEPNTAIQSGDLLANLLPFRSAVRVHGMLIEFDGATQLRIVEGEKDGPIRVELAHGRFVVRESGGSADLEVASLDFLPNRTTPTALKAIRVRANAMPIAVEKLRRPPDPSVVLRVIGSGGKLLIASGEAEVPYDAPTAVDATYAFAANLPADMWPRQVPKISELKAPATLPDWMTNPTPEPVEVHLAEGLAKELTRPGRGVAESLAEVANSSSQLDLRALALAGLGETGDLDSVISALMSAGKRTDRKAAIRVLRELIGRGPRDAAQVEGKLRDVGGKNAEWPALVMLLLNQVRPTDAQWDQRIKDLSRLLGSDDVELRELALDNLMALTDRDEMGYDPDSPSTGKGLAEWQTAADQKALKPPKP